MRHVWCLRKGEGRGFMNELVACVACDCRKRKTCPSYAETPLPDIAKANIQAQQSGYAVAEALPLFEAALSAKDD